MRGIDLLVAAASTKNLDGTELTDHAALKAAGAVAITDDGFPVMDDDLMRGSLEQCAELDLLFMQHAEDIRMTQHAPMTDSLRSASNTAERSGAGIGRETISVNCFSSAVGTEFIICPLINTATLPCKPHSTVNQLVCNIWLHECEQWEDSCGSKGPVATIHEGSTLPGRCAATRPELPWSKMSRRAILKDASPICSQPS